MIVFLLSQLFGLLVFCAVNVGLLFFITYKRNQAFRTPRIRKPVKYHFATAILILFFCMGFSYRVINIRDGVEQLYLNREALPREENFHLLK